MASWIKCACGNSVHKNLFAGAGVSVVTNEEILDQIDDSISARDAINQIIMRSDILVVCSECGRLLIEDATSNGIRSFLPEQPRR